MPVVTGLAVLARKAGRYRLEVDGIATAVVDAELVLDLGLRVGVAFDASLAARVEGGAARLAAFDKGLAALAIRARSERELVRWLARKGHAPEHVAAAVERLGSLGFLNDAEFARSFARSRAVGRGMSRRRIQAELARRGVARDLVDAAVADVMEDEGLDERVLVEAAAARKLPSLSRLEPDVRRRRLYGFLARQGYDSDLVREIVSALLRSAPE